MNRDFDPQCKMAEKRSTDFLREGSSDSFKHQEREKDMYIKSRTFENTNWRQPHSPESQSASHLKYPSHLNKRDGFSSNKFMPLSCAKKESYTPTPTAVDLLYPKFQGMDLKSGNSTWQPQGQPLSGPKSLNPTNYSWRKPVNSMSNNIKDSKNSGPHYSSIQWKVRRKFHEGIDLTAADKKLLQCPDALIQKLGSKKSLYDTMNELDSKTLKVQVDDFQKEAAAVEHVKECMVDEYPNCSVLPYGIRLLGMAHPSAAIYIYLDADNTYHQGSNENKEMQTKIRKVAYEKFKNCGHCDNVIDWDVQELVTFRHTNSEMNCVVSFVNGLKDQNTLLLKCFLKIDKRLRLLMLLISNMVYCYHDISKHFTSYVLNIMIIMYLQRIPDPILPTLQALREGFSYEKHFIGGFDCGFPREFSLPTTTNHSSIESLLKGFCSFYRDFKYEDEVVSILGPSIKRSMICPPYEGEVNAEPLRSFLLSLKTGEREGMKVDRPLIVQDPFELNCNSAEKVNATTLEVFRMLCNDAYDILSKWC